MVIPDTSNEKLKKIDTQKVEAPKEEDPEANRPKYDFDYAQIYRGCDYQVVPGITIHQPTVEEWISYGDEKYWTMVFYLCSNPTSMKLPLWEIGLDWNEMEDFDLFCMLAPSLTPDVTNLVFKDLDFSKFRPLQVDEENKILVNIDNPRILLRKEDYNRMVEYLRTMFSYRPEVRKGKTKSAKELMIWMERDNRRVAEINRKKGIAKENGESLVAMLSFALNHPGFKYKSDELGKITVYQFLDAIKRLQNTENSLAFLHGIYSGMLDTSKMSKAEMQQQLDLTRVL